jgi:hypothetical protein
MMLMQIAGMYLQQYNLACTAELNITQRELADDALRRQQQQRGQRSTSRPR